MHFTLFGWWDGDAEGEFDDVEAGDDFREAGYGGDFLALGIATDDDHAVAAISVPAVVAISDLFVQELQTAQHRIILRYHVLFAAVINRDELRIRLIEVIIGSLDSVLILAWSWELHRLHSIATEGEANYRLRSPFINSMNSMRVSTFDRKLPSMDEVMAMEFCFSTPRIIMQRCCASMTTPTPCGSRADRIVLAIWDVRRSWTCSRRLKTSTSRTILLSPMIFPLGDIGDMTTAKKGKKMVFAHAEHVDILHDDHLIVILAKEGIVQHLVRVLGIALREELEGFFHPLGRLFKPLPVRVLSYFLQNLCDEVFHYVVFYSGVA